MVHNELTTNSVLAAPLHITLDKALFSAYGRQSARVNYVCDVAHVTSGVTLIHAVKRACSGIADNITEHSDTLI